MMVSAMLIFLNSAFKKAHENTHIIVGFLSRDLGGYLKWVLNCSDILAIYTTSICTHSEHVD